MNEALVAAQQLREETRAAAQREAQVIVREAEAEARRVVEEARAAQGEVQRQSADVERQFQAYVAGFRALLERQLAELRALDGQRGGWSTRPSARCGRGRQSFPRSRSSWAPGSGGSRTRWLWRRGSPPGGSRGCLVPPSTG